LRRRAHWLTREARSLSSLTVRVGMVIPYYYAPRPGQDQKIDVFPYQFFRLMVSPVSRNDPLFNGRGFVSLESQMNFLTKKAIGRPRPDSPGRARQPFRVETTQQEPSRAHGESPGQGPHRPQ
jgi:hypothetical protein